MNHNQQAQLRQAMEEVVSLPTDHPRRQAVLRQIEREGKWARTDWAELVREEEQLRLELRNVAAPEGLRERLQAIPDQASVAHRRHWSRHYRVAGMLAAACLVLAAILLVNLRPDSPSFEQAVQHVANLAVDDHLKRPELSITTGDPAQVASHLQPHVAFAIDVPSMDHALSLIGARICKFDERPIAHTRWRDRQREGKEHSVYQFCAADFDLPEQFIPMRIEVPAVPGRSQAYEVLIWSAGECAYVMVCEGAVPLTTGSMAANIR